MCFGDGIQYTTGCAFGKGNIRKQAYGKLVFTLIEKASGRAVSVAYKPTLQSRSAPRLSYKSGPPVSTQTRFWKRKCCSR